MNRITQANQILAEQLIDSIMKDYDAVGLAACIIDETGYTQYEIFKGYRDLETKKPVNEDTIFGLASVTKSFTAMAIMQMAEKGIISLTDPVSKYIPEFTNKNTQPVTIQHLLSHAGGFFPTHRTTMKEVIEKYNLKISGDPAYNVELAEKGAEAVCSLLDEQTMEKGLHGLPGERMSYCNDGFGLLSEIIRRYGGHDSYAEYLHEEILVPANMTRSFCDFIKPTIDENASILYFKEDGELKGHRDYMDNAFVLNGGGAMKSTLHDLKEYLYIYLNEGKTMDGERIIKDTSIREMCKPRQRHSRYGYYGYGLYTDILHDLNVIEHGGSLPGVSSNIAFTYDNDCAVIVLCNTSDVPVSVISNALLKMYAGYSPISTREYREYPWDKETILKALGTYCSLEDSSFELLQNEDGTLSIKDENNTRAVIPVSPNTAIIRNKYSDTFLKLIETEERGVFAIQYGSRVIPKQ